MYKNRQGLQIIVLRPDHFNWLAWSRTWNLRRQGGWNVSPGAPERNEGCLVFVNYFSRVCSFVRLTAHHQSKDMGKDSGWSSEKKKRNDRKKNLSSELSHAFAKPTFNHIALRSCLCPAGVEPVHLWEKEDHSVWLKDREQRVSASVGLCANI